MKHLLISLIFLVLTVCSKSQEYIPFPLEGASWTNGYYQLVAIGDWYDYELQQVSTFETSGDTAIDGMLYAKVTSDNAYFIENTQGTYVAAIRESEGRVFVIPAGDQTEKILYDFTLEAGELINVFNLSQPNGTEVPMEVLSTSYLDFNGITRKVIEFEGGNWIEGIGNDRGMFWEVSVNISDYWTYLECFTMDGASTFESADGNLGCTLSSFQEGKNEISIYPNPSNGFIQIEGMIDFFAIEVFDQQGKLVVSKKDGKFKTGSGIDLSALKSGLFFLRIHSEDVVSSHRIILE